MVDIKVVDIRIYIHIYIIIYIYVYLVGSLEHCLFFHILGMSSSQLTKSYFPEGLAQPPTSNCTVYINTETYGKLWKITIFNGNITIFNRKTMENHHF